MRNEQMFIKITNQNCAEGFDRVFKCKNYTNFQTSTSVKNSAVGFLRAYFTFYLD